VPGHAGAGPQQHVRRLYNADTYANAYAYAYADTNANADV
jgi:hypothetical protein